MTALVATIISACLVGPFIVGKILRSLDEKRWKRKLQGLTERYSPHDEQDKRSFHVKRLR